MSNYLNEAIQEIDEDIQELQKRKDLLLSLDFSKPVDEATWHEICQTSLRYSDALIDIVKNIFPQAEDIKRGSNYVYFTLLGFNVQIPTSLVQGINVDTSWIHSVRRPVSVYWNESAEKMKKYLKLVDEKAGWYELAKCRCTTEWRFKICYFFWWWFKYKWKKIDRAGIEKVLKQQEDAYAHKLQENQQELKEMNERLVRFKNELFPLIETFSTHHYYYNDRRGYYTLEEILQIDEVKEKDAYDYSDYS